MESTTPSGLRIIEHRAVWRDDSTPIVPNENDPADVPPATVGPPSAVPGDPNGFEVISEGTPAPPSRVWPSAWSGWPADWLPPNWYGRVEALTDTAWSCLDYNSMILATMPAYLVGVSPSLPADWLNNPDPSIYAGWHAFARQLFWDFMMGEAFVLTTARYSNGYPARFRVIPPWTVNVEMDAGGTRRYEIGSLDVTDDILHIPYQIAANEARGHGPLEAGAGRMVAANALARYAYGVASSGGIPNSVLTHPVRLTADQSRELQTQWVEARLSSMGLPAVLSGGVDFKTLSFSPKDMALIDLDQFNDSRICVLLGVPPFLMALPSGGDSMTYSNVQWVFVFHWRASLSTKASAVMGALSGWLLPRGTSIELNRDEYVKPDLGERAEAYVKLNGIRDSLGNPVLAVEEIRQLERYDNAAPTSTLTAGVLQ